MCIRDSHNGTYWKETRERGQTLLHLVLGCEGTEAGDYYNKIAFDYIKDQIQINPNRRNFDPVKEVTSFMNEHLGKYLEFQDNPSIPPTIKLEREPNGLARLVATTTQTVLYKKLPHDLLDLPSTERVNSLSPILPKHHFFETDTHLMFICELAGLCLLYTSPSPRDS
eukprot:TRINITY_DN16768_c0_g1_i1.p1 TRINITY_DN16768_c0_g1~~TRINITY_DN16768_c0_g1_i1.p1  ORF type:complete len:168 (+),score=28.22 TRINITY_DN16768_c0_g1_i1:62-565(+)